jgi:hypothetical protein
LKKVQEVDQSVQNGDHLHQARDSQESQPRLQPAYPRHTLYSVPDIELSTPTSPPSEYVVGGVGSDGAVGVIGVILRSAFYMQQHP